MPKGRILAVDDQRYFRELVEDLLSEEGWETQTASSGEEAIRILEQSTFDVILTDLVMPGMDGCDLVHRIKERDPEQDVIVVTGVVDVKTAVDAMRLGASDYLLKPFDRVTLIRSVENLMQRRRLRAEHARLLAENVEYLGEQSLFERAVGFLSCLSLDPLAQRMVEGLCIETRAQGGVVWIARGESEESLQLAAARGLVRLQSEPERIEAHQIPPELREGSVRTAIAAWNASGEGPEPPNRALLLALRTGSRLVGLVRLTDKLGGGEFEAADSQAAEKLARFAEMALGNALRFASLERPSFLDPATGVYSREFFEDTVHNEIGRAQRFGRGFSLLAFDLAPLAEAGAERIAEAVKILGKVVRTTDLLATLCENQFRVLLTEVDAVGAAILKQRAQQAFEALGDAVQPGGQRPVLAAVTYPSDGTQLETLTETLDERLRAEHLSPVRRLGLDRMPLAASLARLLAEGAIEPHETADQITRFFLAEVRRRPGQRGLLFLAPGTALEQAVRQGIEQLGDDPATTEIMVVGDGERLAKEGPPITWVSPDRVPGLLPFLVQFGDGPSYALERDEKQEEDGVQLFHTSDRSVVEHLAFRLRAELTPNANLADAAAGPVIAARAPARPGAEPIS